jgi:hypothetical protein
MVWKHTLKSREAGISPLDMDMTERKMIGKAAMITGMLFCSIESNIAENQ